jgi:hypothetical protein
LVLSAWLDMTIDKSVDKKKASEKTQQGAMLLWPSGAKSFF